MVTKDHSFIDIVALCRDNFGSTLYDIINVIMILELVPLVYNLQMSLSYE